MAVWAFSSCREQGLPFAVVLGFLIAVASLVLGRGLWAHVGSAAVAHRLSGSTTREIFPDQGLNLCPLHWQVNF